MFGSIPNITNKELVTLAKRTRLNQVLDKTLKQCVVTRWNSVLTTMMSIADNSSDLRTYASEPGANKNVLRLVCSINEELLMQVIAVLKPFDSATKILSTDKSASIHLVVPTKRRLHQHLKPVALDSEIIEQLKNHLRSQYSMSVSCTTLQLCWIHV